MYGAPRIHAELKENGVRVGRKRVARLMAAADLVGVSRRKFVATTVRGGGRQAPDLVDCNFAADKPDVGCRHHLRSDRRKFFVFGGRSRCIVGWAMSSKLVTRLVLDALDMALATRRAHGVIHHSDRARNIPPSSLGSVVGKRVCGPRWARSETPTTTPCAKASSPRWSASLLARQRFKNQTEARTAVFGRPQVAILDGRSARRLRRVRAGTEEWLRRGPNKRIGQQRRTK